jgi:putative hydrolase of the HAD superfamily
MALVALRRLARRIRRGAIGIRSNPMATPMKKAPPITALLLDIGGVLLNNGWDHIARRRAARQFKLEWAEMEERHRLTFETHEEGKLTFEEYLGRVVFFQKRPFTRAQFRRFMFAQSKPCPEMIDLIAHLKVRYGLKIAVVSNEARELNAYRIREFKLDAFVDSFISSCFVHVRKPDADIFRLALDIVQAPARQVVYIENTPMFVQIAEGLGIRSILHTDYKSTCAKLASFGLANEGGFPGMGPSESRNAETAGVIPTTSAGPRSASFKRTNIR